MVGDTLRTRSLIIDRYVKRDREYVVNEVIVSNSAGAIVSRSRTHQSFLLPERKTEGFVVDRSRHSGGVEPQDHLRVASPAKAISSPAGLLFF